MKPNFSVPGHTVAAASVETFVCVSADKHVFSSETCHGTVSFQPVVGYTRSSHTNRIKERHFICSWQPTDWSEPQVHGCPEIPPTVGCAIGSQALA